MALTTYPYVFLLSTESFAIAGKSQLEASRILGTDPWRSFRRIALPIALPSIGAGIALMGMEVINELGAVLIFPLDVMLPYTLPYTIRFPSTVISPLISISGPSIEPIEFLFLLC